MILKFSLFLIFFTTQSFAIENYSNKMVTAMQNAVTHSNQFISETSVVNENAADLFWYFNEFRLAITPFVSFGVSSAVNIHVTPQVLFIWTRKNPEGWKNLQ
jgi:hypothetical protein